VAPPAAGQIPTIILSTSGKGLAREPQVFIPVGTPGIDHAGQVFRADAVVALPLPSLRDSALPGVARVLDLVGERLEKGVAP
jgi:formylmethanofuran dehydrogenase subunit B